MVTSLLTRPRTWVVVLMAGVMAFVIGLSYLGGFLDPSGNLKALPIALVSEDRGAVIDGQPMNYGAQIIAQVTTPNATLGSRVKWTVLATRQAALDQLRQDKYYAAIVVPAGYTSRLSTLVTPDTQGTVPVRIEVLTNLAAGSAASTTAEDIAARVVMDVSSSAIAQLTRASGSAGGPVVVSTAAALAIAQSTQPVITTGVPIGEKSGRGLAPFYFALMLAMAGYLGTTIVNIGVDFLAGERDADVLAWRLRLPALGFTRTRLWFTKLTLSLGMALIAGVSLTWLAAGLIRMPASDSWALGQFAVLSVAAVSMLTMIFETALGAELGALLALLVAIVLGVPSAGGVYPLEMVSGFFQFLGTWLPLRYITDGARSFVYFNGSHAAGLSTSLVVLVLYVVLGFLLSGVTANRLARYTTLRAKAAHVHATSATMTLHHAGQPTLW